MMELDKVHNMDALELLRSLDAQSVDAVQVQNIPYSWYNTVTITVKEWDMNELEICRLYVEERLTLRQIADKFNTNHHMIRRILGRHGIEITTVGRKRKPFSDEHRRRIGDRKRGTISPLRGISHTEEFKRKDMRGKLGTSIDLSQYVDYDKLLFLTRMMSKRRKELKIDDTLRKQFLDKFYFDRQFNLIWDAWIAADRDRWYRPTLDHKHPSSRNGAWDLDNLQFLTWFENRAKADMTEEEWQDFCQRTQTNSMLFIRG